MTPPLSTREETIFLISGIILACTGSNIHIRKRERSAVHSLYPELAELGKTRIAFCCTEVTQFFQHVTTNCKVISVVDLIQNGSSRLGAKPLKYFKDFIINEFYHIFSTSK